MGIVDLQAYSELLSSEAPLCCDSLSLFPHQRPQRFDVAALGQLAADRDAHHPAVVENGGREIGAAGAVDAIAPAGRVPIERFARQPIGLVADADRLQIHRREDAPLRCRGDLVRRASARWPGRGAAASCSAVTPCSRIMNQSFSARNRRPSGMPQSR